MASTSFWFHHWLPDGPLSSSHTTLLTHTTRPNVPVPSVFQNSRFDLCLRPRLTYAASAQLASLISYMQGVYLWDGPDVRVLRLTGMPYTSKGAYAALDRLQEALDAHGQSIWGARMPNKMKIFTWLYYQPGLESLGL